MSSQYDAILKTIMAAPRSLFVETVTRLPRGEPLPTDAGWFTARNVDYISKLGDQSYVHIEVQTKNDDTMHWRMANYYTLLNHKIHQWKRSDIEINQFLLYIGPGSNTMLAAHPSFGEPYKYHSIVLASRAPGNLPRSPYYGDRILALLMWGSTKEDWKVITSAICKMRDEARRLEGLFFISQLSSLRGARAVVEEVIVEMGMYEALRDTPLTARAAEANSIGTVADMISEYLVETDEEPLSDEEREILIGLRLPNVKLIHKAITRQGRPRSVIVAAAVVDTSSKAPGI